MPATIDPFDSPSKSLHRLHNIAALHGLKLGVLIALALLLCGIYVWLGSAKSRADIDVIDVVGEVGVSVIITLWIGILLIARPGGRVTNILYAGTGCFWLSSLLDVMDEFVRAPADSRWFSWLESLPLTAGLVLISYGLWLWYREQQGVNRQLRSRERFYREHALIDHLTQLNGAVYMTHQLRRELILHKHQGQPLSLALIDLDDFDDYNRRYGTEQGDQALLHTAELILLTIRATDLACRYAGDRFIVLMPKTPSDSAQLIARQLHDTLKNHYWHNRASLSATVITLTATPTDSADSLIERANDALHSHKRHHCLREAMP
ncbi:GGDEF domain-containing protein [Exilibacterium tricleocarpae]|uniref:diguanylate cyclase n=1 Tax=Exilibacterium tricleocarpae TaxID=2591008 RepID=A0A545TNF0_9GAMM|nr:GGDEF domain-containing protein [Exilibacterium tricleocarpae]TQV78750.1 GGDEF domain-containing protein [Exilibacterium tricleocarpae]